MANKHEIIFPLFCYSFLQVQVDNLQISEVVPDILLHDKPSKSTTEAKLTVHSEMTIKTET